MKTKLYTQSAAVPGAAATSTGFAGLPNDGANAKEAHVNDLHGVRYIEFFVWGGNDTIGNLQANVYNTSLAAGFDPKTDKDSAPQAYVGGINTEEIKKQFGALAVSINGPKQWMLDWIDVPLGKEREFDGKEIPWCAKLHLKKSQLKTLGKVGYESTTIERKSAFGYNKGTTVFLIDDADGNTWVMKGFELGMKPRWTYEEFAADPASHFQKLPPGWQFRTRVLDKDLILIPQTGVATIMSDEFFDVYDKTGPGNSNYTP